MKIVKNKFIVNDEGRVIGKISKVRYENNRVTIYNVKGETVGHTSLEKLFDVCRALEKIGVLDSNDPKLNPKWGIVKYIGESLYKLGDTIGYISPNMDEMFEIDEENKIIKFKLSSMEKEIREEIQDEFEGKFKNFLRLYFDKETLKPIKGNTVKNICLKSAFEKQVELYNKSLILSRLVAEVSLISFKEANASLEEALSKFGYKFTIEY